MTKGLVILVLVGIDDLDPIRYLQRPHRCDKLDCCSRECGSKLVLGNLNQTLEHTSIEAQQLNTPAPHHGLIPSIRLACSIFRLPSPSRYCRQSFPACSIAVPEPPCPQATTAPKRTACSNS
jgi:hypothetical protein